MKTAHALSENLPTALKLLRLKTGLKQREVAERAGITRSQLSAYERRRVMPRMESLLKVLEALGTDLRGLQRAVEALSKQNLPREGGS